MMTSRKDTYIIVGLFLTVALTTASMLVNNSIEATNRIDNIKSDYDFRYGELKTDVKEDITEIKQDVKAIKKYLGVP